MPSKKNASASPSLEEAMHRLEEIVERLEQGDVPLEQAMELYEEGLSISKLCAEKLAKAELILKRLSKDAEGNFTLADEQE